MIVQVLYGIVADKYGRKIVMFLAFFGCIIQITWQLAVSKCSSAMLPKDITLTELCYQSPVPLHI